MSAFVAIVKRDLTLALRRKNEVITSVFFFVVVAALFPLGIGPEMNTLRLVAPGILWVGALLASMLSLSRMFATDYADGTLEQMALSPNSLSLMVAAKILAHWLLSGLPLVLLAPILGLQFDLSTNALWVLTLSLLLGTPVLSLIGAVGAALTLGVRGGSIAGDQRRPSVIFEAARLLALQIVDPDDMLDKAGLPDRAHQRGKQLLGRDEHRARARIVEDVRVIAAGVGGVGRDGDAPGGHDREVGDAPFGTVFGDQHHAVAVLQPHAPQCLGQQAHLRGRFAPADRLPCAAAFRANERLVAPFVGPLKEQLDEIGS